MSTEPKPESPAELAATLKDLRRRRSGIACGLLTAAACDKLDTEQDVLIDRLAALATIHASASASQEPVAWQWRKRQTWFAGKADECHFWSEWEALQPPYMDARDLAKSDPENYELRPLYTAATQARPASGEAWRPIAEAPKDGTHILAMIPDSDTCHVICWVDASKDIRKGCGVYGWHVAWDGYPLAGYSSPICWQHLPAAPTSTPSAASPGTGTGTEE